MSALDYAELYRLRTVTENLAKYIDLVRENGFPGSSTPAHVAARLQRILEGKQR